MTVEVGNEELEHTDVAAYALGLLEDSDRLAFEAHLARCSLCAEELGDFAGMAELFAGVPPIEPTTADEENVAGGQLIDMLRRRKVAARSRRRGTAVLGAAAGVILLAGGAIAGVFAAGDAGHPRTVAMPGHSGSFDEVFRVGEKASATDARTGATGMVAMQPKGWGTNIGLQLSHVRGPLVCKLVAVSRTGTRHTVTEWRVPAAGQGPPAGLEVHGGTAVERADLARFDVEVEGSDRTLLSIPV